MTLARSLALACFLFNTVLWCPVGAAQGPEQLLVSGVLVTNEQKPAPLRRLFFVPTTNFCPETCSCGTGRCEGGAECKGKFCFYGFAARSNKDGLFGINLPNDKYDLYADRISEDRKLPLSVAVEGKAIQGLRITLPPAPPGAVARGDGNVGR
jgi:hypothetical protein